MGSHPEKGLHSHSSSLITRALIRRTPVALAKSCALVPVVAVLLSTTTVIGPPDAWASGTSVASSSTTASASSQTKAYAETTANSDSPNCSSDFDPYAYTAAAVALCPGWSSYPASVSPLPDGGTSYGYVVDGMTVIMNVAPSGWNPTAASQSELATYGIPPRPASSDPSYGSWIARWANVHFVTPPSFLAVGPSDRFDVTSNWGGYAQKGSSCNPFTTIVSTWTEPADNNSACTTNIAPFWVGIGGSNGATNLIQAGSQIETNLSGNGANQQAWWEDYPAGPVFLPYYAAAGDPFSVDIQYEGAVGGQSFQITLYSPNEGFQDTMVEHMAYGINLSSSAEAVVEMLGGTNGIPLSNFGTLTFSNVYTNVGSLAPTSQAWVISDSGPGTSGTLTKLLSTPNSSGGFSETQLHCE